MGGSIFSFPYLGILCLTPNLATLIYSEKYSNLENSMSCDAPVSFDWEMGGRGAWKTKITDCMPLLSEKLRRLNFF